MQKIVRVELIEPIELPDGSQVTVLEASESISISREPPDDWPAVLVVKAQGREFRRPWEGNVKSHGAVPVLGSKPHSVVALGGAKEFLEYLVDDARETDRYLFRGVARSDYDLLPTALRTAGPLPFGAILKSNREQIEQEARVALHFFDAVHFQGLTIPGWSEVRRIMEAIRNHELPRTWPPDEILEFLAIAQHHGIPTRLLDWTLDPMVAAYFAACDLAADSPLVAVWILDRRASWSFVGPPGLWQGLLHPIVVPYDLNRNAHAQQGVFTPQIQLSSVDHAGAPSRTPLDEVLSFRATRDPPNGIRKVTLPRSEIAGLLQRLHRRRINGSTMFPGYSGAAKAAKERAFWAA